MEREKERETAMEKTEGGLLNVYRDEQENERTSERASERTRER